VSNPMNQNNYLTSEKLCAYLLKHHHFSPFEMVNVCVEIETTRDISRQVIRHRSFSFQEFSQRYADPTTILGFTTRECRLQHPKNRQMSVPISDDDHSGLILATEFERLQQELVRKQQDLVNFCINNNIAKEQARTVLSEGLTKTRMYMNGNIRSWIHYIQIRTDHTTTQKEHADLARKIAYELAKVFPMITSFISTNL
jgi:thymidylate synthase (FAD)